MNKKHKLIEWSTKQGNMQLTCGLVHIRYILIIIMYLQFQEGTGEVSGDGSEACGGASELRSETVADTALGALGCGESRRPCEEAHPP